MSPVTSDKSNSGVAKQPRDAYLNKTKLKARGWTDSLISKLLGAPDETRRNPYYLSSPPQQLFLRRRVEAIEATAEFQDALEVTQKRRQAAKAAAEKRRERTLDAAEAIDIVVPKLERDKLIDRACKAYNGRKLFENDFVSADSTSDQEFLDRICVNYIRHELTKYDSDMTSMQNLVGAAEARDIIREQVYYEISYVYPYLAKECRRQLRRRRDREMHSM